jgi:hypothetical protein
MDVKPKFENGDIVKDKITGFQGTVTCVAVYWNGCIRYNIQPKLDKNGHHQDSEVMDEQQLELVKPIKKPEPKKKGGDRPFLPSYKL